MTPVAVSPLAEIDRKRLVAPEAARSAEMQALFDWLTELDKDLPDLATLPIAEVRAIRARRAERINADLPEVASLTRLAVPGLAGSRAVVCELIVPNGASPGCIVYLHGGGWVHGDLASHARLAHTLLITTGMRVLYVDYRLAPENPYPAALEDTIAAWRWSVSESARNSAFQGPLAIAGDSAGANLALAAMLREMEIDRRIPDLALLFYGVYSADLDSPSYLRFAEGYGLTRAAMAGFWDMYAPGGAGPGSLRHDALVSPVEASEAALARLPPLYLCAAGLDPLLFDTIGLAERLDAAGATYELTIHEGVQHGFMQHTARLEEARRAFRLAGAFFARTTTR
jgi:acetyl esterase